MILYPRQISGGGIVLLEKVLSAKPDRDAYKVRRVLSKQQLDIYRAMLAANGHLSRWQLHPALFGDSQNRAPLSGAARASLSRSLRRLVMWGMVKLESGQYRLTEEGQNEAQWATEWQR